MCARAEEFEKFFGEFGEVEDSIVMLDQATGKSRGFGFVTFADEATGAKLLSKKNYTLGVRPAPLYARGVP